MKDLEFADRGESRYFYSSHSYGQLVDSFEVTTLVEEHDNDYQGDSYYLLSDGDRFGILIFGWGSCSGCDALEACDSPQEVYGLRDSLWESIEWRNEADMIEYLREKDWELEWYYRSSSYSEGRNFVHAVLRWFDLPVPGETVDEDEN